VFGGLLALQSTLHAQSAPGAVKSVPTLKDVRYGKYDRDLLDVFQVKTAKPAPVLIYYHGGGWLGGDKNDANPSPCSNAGSPWSRRIIGSPPALPTPPPFRPRCWIRRGSVQFVRSKAKEWNIDPNRIALTGSSAGAVICMWIAYHDDLAKPASPDPVERFSTRVTCILPQSGPSTLDPKLILKLILKRIGGDHVGHRRAATLLRIKKFRRTGCAR